MRKITLRKNQILICKMFDINKDGEWTPEHTKIYQRRDMKYVEYQLQKYILEHSNNNDLPTSWYKQLTDDKYIIIMRIVKNSKKCKCLLEYGFTIIS